MSCRLNDTTGAKKRLEAVREAVQRSPDWAQFELYQGGIARGMLPHAMDDADKYRLMARDLRARAIVPEMAFQRREVISLAARFEVLAIEADHIQGHLATRASLPNTLPSSLRSRVTRGLGALASGDRT